MEKTPDFVFRGEVESVSQDVLNGWKSIYDLWDNMKRYNDFVRFHNLNSNYQLIPQEVLDTVGRNVMSLQNAYNMLAGIPADPSKGQLEVPGLVEFFPEEPSYRGG